MGCVWHLITVNSYAVRITIYTYRNCEDWCRVSFRPPCQNTLVHNIDVTFAAEIRISHDKSSIILIHRAWFRE